MCRHKNWIARALNRKFKKLSNVRTIMYNEDGSSLNADDSLSSNAESVLSQPNTNSVDYREKFIQFCCNSSNSVGMTSSEPTNIVAPTVKNIMGDSPVTAMSSAAQGETLNIFASEKYST